MASGNREQGALVQPQSEGKVDWKDYKFRQVLSTDWERVVKHIQTHFMREEPTCQLLGYSDDFGQDVEALLRKMMADHLSYLVEHKTTSEIIGLSIAFRRNHLTTLEDVKVDSYSGNVFLRLVDILDKMANLCESFGLEEFAELFITSIDPKFLSVELVSEIYRKNEELLKTQGFKLVKGMFTTNCGRAAVKTLGYQEVCRLEYTEFVDEEGELVFNVGDLREHHFASVMVKLL